MESAGVTVYDVEQMMLELKAKNPTRSIDRTAALAFLSGILTGLVRPTADTIRHELNHIFGADV